MRPREEKNLPRALRNSAACTRKTNIEEVAEDEVKAGLVTSRRIIFTPAVDLKDELASTAIQITCYNRDGKEVKRVTSGDGGDVENPENNQSTPSNGGNDPIDESNGDSDRPRGNELHGGIKKQNQRVLAELAGL